MKSLIFLIVSNLLFANCRELKNMPTSIKITDEYITDLKPRVGLSTLNYADSDKRRVPGYIPIKSVIKEINPGMLRFPGGLEASSYLWATAPYWEPSSHALAFRNESRWPNAVYSIVQNESFVDAMNFEEFMDIANFVGSEVTIVINFESMYNVDGPSKDLLIETARQWVRYCKKKNYTNVKYWEIGNETDMKSSYNGRMENATQYAKDAREFIDAMKMEDSSILVGVNGYHDNFIEEVLNNIGNYIDFFVVHNYPFYNFSKGYENFTKRDGNYNTKYDRVMNALNRSTMSQDKKESLFFMVTETSVIDWHSIETGVGWKGNDVGHAIGMFELIGKLMVLEKVRGSLIWTTHWVDKPTESTEIYNILDNKNHYNPITYGILPWSHAGDGKLMNVIYNSNEISAYAIDNGTYITSMIANKMSYPVSVNIEFNLPVKFSYVYYGESDISKEFLVETLPDEIPKTLRALSITVIGFENN